MRRRRPQTFGHSITRSRVLSMLLALAVLGMLYNRLRDPATLRWLAGENDDTQPQPEALQQPPPTSEIIVPGRNDLDAAEKDDFLATARVIEDSRALKPHEMPAYWKLMAWSRSQSLAELERRAKRDVPYTRLWQQPALYRGQPIRLRLHVRRVLEYPASENTLGINQLYEAWGWTDESLSYPYVVVFADRPPGLPIGTDVEGEIVFVGYFLKEMGYQAFDVRHASPLLVGRARMVSMPVVADPIPATEIYIALLVIGGCLLVGTVAVVGFTLGLRRRTNRRRTQGSAAGDKLPNISIPVTPQDLTSPNIFLTPTARRQDK